MPARQILCSLLVLPLLLAACQPGPGGVDDSLADESADTTLSDARMTELVRRSYQYVAMFNVNNKMAIDESNPMNTGGYNHVRANTQLADHRLQVIARPNNDTLYVGAMIDVTEEPIVLRIPAFDSTYVSLMVTGYDHYVNIPMSTRLGDFAEPQTVLFYSARTPNYDGAPVAGVDRIMETTGDFVSAIFRVMPHAAEPQRMRRNVSAMHEIDVVPLSAFLGNDASDLEYIPWNPPPGIGRRLSLREDQARFPEFGTDMEIFEERLLEVMQFVLNHTTFDPNNELDAALLSVYEPLGIAPGQAWDLASVPAIDGAAVRRAAEKVAAEALARMQDPEFIAADITRLFQPKDRMTLDLLVFQSVVGPIGLPASEALYPSIVTSDGQPMNAMFDYEIVMEAEDLPPVEAFWSVTLYDSENGFFIPNDRFKYSVGENAGYRLDEDGGIRIAIAAAQPDGVAEENWLPINRGDYDVDIIMRLYAPDLARFADWTPPRAVRVTPR